MPKINKAPTGTAIANRIKVAVTDGEEVFNSGTSLSSIGGSGVFTEDASFNLYGGTSAGASLIAGAVRNVLAGQNAGTNITTGDDNIAIGKDAGMSIITSDDNVAIGRDAIGKLSGGDIGGFNVGIGANALSSTTSTSATANIGVGVSSLRNISTGDSNVGFGDGAGINITTGTDGVFLGNRAGPTTNQSNQLYIHNATSDTPLIHGNFSTSVATINGDLTVTDETTLKKVTETKSALSGTTPTVNLNNGTVFTHTVATGATTYTFSNPGAVASFTLIVTNGESQTVTWPTSVDWAGGTKPTLTTSGVDVLTFITADSGTIWYGFVGGLDMK